MGEILLNPGPTNTRFATKMHQWLGSDICHRDDKFINILSRLQKKLLAKSNFRKTDNIAVMAGSGTTALEAMIATLVPDDTLVIVAGKYGLRASEIMTANNIKHKTLESKTINDLKICHETKYVFYVENETSTGEHYSPSKMAKYFPNANFFVDATSSFGAHRPYKSSNRIIAFSFCSNKCLQSTPGLGIVIWRKDLKKYLRSYVGDLSKYKIGSLPFTLPVQSVCALDYTLDKIKDNKQIFDNRSKKLISEFASIGIQCRNKNPCNSIVAFKHPTKSYEELKNYMSQRNIVLYSGVPGVDKSFRVATMSVKFDSHFKKIMGAFYDSCLC